MVVNYLNIFGISINPTETDPKLIVDANAMLASAILL
jgi:hypothetical protein